MSETTEIVLGVIGMALAMFYAGLAGYLRGYRKGYLKGRRMRGVLQVPKAKNPPPPPRRRPFTIQTNTPQIGR